MVNTKRKLTLWLISIIMLISITGCWNRVELNELAVNIAMGVDKHGDNILVSRQVVNRRAIVSKGGSSSGDAPVTLFQETGKSMLETGRKVTTKSTRKSYSGHLQMFIISEELAKEGLGKVLDYATREQEFRKDFFVVIAKDTKAVEILKIYTPLEKIPATKMFNSLETSSKVWGATGAIKIDQFISDIISKGKEAVVTGIKIEGNQKLGETKENVEKIKPMAELQYNGLAVFKKDKLVGWLNEEESRVYNLSQGEVKSTTVVIPCNETKKNITVELIRIQVDTQFEKQNGKPQINMNISVEGNVTDAQCNIDLTNPESIYKLEKLAEKEIKQIIIATLKAAQKKYHSDILGFGNVIRRTDPIYWNGVQGDWDQEFPDLQVNVKVKTQIRRVYKTKRTIEERLQE